MNEYEAEMDALLKGDRVVLHITARELEYYAKTHPEWAKEMEWLEMWRKIDPSLALRDTYTISKAQKSNRRQREEVKDLFIKLSDASLTILGILIMIATSAVVILAVMQAVQAVQAMRTMCQ